MTERTYACPFPECLERLWTEESRTLHIWFVHVKELLQP